jgi:hypothetical protein
VISPCGTMSCEAIVIVSPTCGRGGRVRLRSSQTVVSQLRKYRIFHMLDPQLSWECMHGIAKTNFKSLQWSACLRLTSVVTWVLHRAWRCSGKRPCPEHNLHRLRSDRSHHHGRGRLTYAQCSCDAHRTKRYCTAGERHCRGAWCVIQSIILLTCIYAKNDSEPDFALAQDSSRGCRNRHCR